MIIEFFVPRLARVEGCNACVADRAGMMIVHPIFVSPDVDGAGQEDHAEAEQSTVSLLITGALHRHSRLRLLAARAASQFHWGSFVDCYIILVALFGALGGNSVRDC